MAMTANCRVLATGTYRPVQLWDVERGTLLDVFEGHSLYVLSIALSRDGRILVTGSGDTTARVWDVLARANTNTIQHKSAVSYVALSSDGSIFATSEYTGRHSTVRVFRLPECELIFSHAKEGFAGYARCIALDTDGKTLYSGADEEIALWDIQRGKRRRTFVGHTHRVTALAVSEDGSVLISGSDDETTRVWSTRTGVCERTFSSESGFWDDEFKMYATDNRDNRPLFSPLTVTNVAASEDARVVASSNGRRVRVWDVRSGELAHVLVATSCNSLALGDDGRTAVTAATGSGIRIWNLQAEQQWTRDRHESSVESLALSSNEQTLVSGSNDETARVWNVENGSLSRTIGGHAGPVQSVAVSANGQIVASVAWDKTVRIWDANKGKLIHALGDHNGMIGYVFLDDRGERLLSIDEHGDARLWDVSTGALIRMIETGKKVPHAAFCGRGRILVSEHYRELRVWDVSTGRIDSIIQASDAAPGLRRGEFGKLVLSADGKTLAAECGQALTLWDLSTGRFMRAIEEWGRHIALSQTGRFLAVAGECVQVWDTVIGRVVVDGIVCESSLGALAISGDGQRLFVGDNDGDVYRFDLLTMTSSGDGAL